MRTSWQTGYQGWMREAAHCGRARGDAQSGAVLTQRRPVSLAAGVAGQGHVLPMAAVVRAPRPPGALQEAALPSRAADVVQPHGPRVLLGGVHGGPPAVSVGKTRALRRAAPLASGNHGNRSTEHAPIERHDSGGRAAPYPRPGSKGHLLHHPLRSSGQVLTDPAASHG